VHDHLVHVTSEVTALAESHIVESMAALDRATDSDAATGVGTTKNVDVSTVDALTSFKKTVSERAVDGNIHSIVKVVEIKRPFHLGGKRRHETLKRHAGGVLHIAHEADGIAGANEIIAGSLSREYLSWYWIDNLQNHDSVVYMVPSEGGIPLFKDIDSAMGSEKDSTHRHRYRRRYG